MDVNVTMILSSDIGKEADKVMELDHDGLGQGEQTLGKIVGHVHRVLNSMIFPYFWLKSGLLIW